MTKEFDSNEIWETTISPDSKLFSISFQEIWNYRDLLMLFVKRDFAAQYKQTILGPLWHLIQPLLTTLIFIIVFSKFASIPTDGIPPMLFYLSGLSIWNYFSSCLLSTSNTFVANASIFGKIYFPRLILPLSAVISNLLKFAIHFLLLTAFLVWYAIKGHGFYFGFSWLLIPVLVLMMALMGLGLGIIVSSLTTKYRDMSHLVTFGVQLLMYVAPISYPLSFLKNKSYASWIQWNPLTPILESFRYAIFNVGELNFSALIYSLICICFFTVVGLIIFGKVEKTFMDTV